MTFGEWQLRPTSFIFLSFDVVQRIPMLYFDCCCFYTIQYVFIYVFILLSNCKHVLGTPTMYIWWELFNYNSKLHRKKNTNYKFHIKTTNNSFLFLSWSVVQNIPCKTSLLLHLMHFFFRL